MKKFGLVGENISYSFSKNYFDKKFIDLHLESHFYEVFDIDSLHKIPDIFKIPNLFGLNVTIPFKEKIIPFLDELSDEAKEIEAVNCISIKNKKKIGFNTDVFGFEMTLNLFNAKAPKSALILGNGGAAKAVKYVLEKRNITYKTVSRNSELNFENLGSDIVKSHELIIQCTPVGTSPNINHCLEFPFEALSKNHIVIDLIYNPTETLFLKKSREKEAKTSNGLLMLKKQAEKSWEIWNLS